MSAMPNQLLAPGPKLARVEVVAAIDAGQEVERRLPGSRGDKDVVDDDLVHRGGVHRHLVPTVGDVLHVGHPRALRRVGRGVRNGLDGFSDNKKASNTRTRLIITA